MESHLIDENEEDYNIDEFSEEPQLERSATNPRQKHESIKLKKNIPKDFGVKFDFTSKKGRPKEHDIKLLSDCNVKKYRINSANRAIDFKFSEINKTKIELNKLQAKSMGSGKFDNIEEEEIIDLKPAKNPLKKSKFKKFKEEDPIEKRTYTQDQQNTLFLSKVNTKNLTHEISKNKEIGEMKLKQNEDVDLYFKNVEEVCEFKQINISDGDCDDSDEDIVHIFKAKPDKFRKDRIFNFLTKEINQAKMNQPNNATPGFQRNPFETGFPFDQIDSGSTPLFKLKPAKSEEEEKENEDYWLDANVKADFDKSERYLYEFFNHKDYYKFKEEYFKHLEQANKTKSSKVKKVSIGEQLNNSKKVIFFEIDKTILLLSEEKIEGLPHFKYIGEELASYFGRKPFFIYLRPFVFGFLNALKSKFNLAVYSKYNKNLLIFLLDILQEEKEFFFISITHNIKKRAKSIDKFLTEGRSKKNVLLIDMKI